MLDLTKLWNAMPRDVQLKISCHDLKRIVDNYNAPEGWVDPAPGHPEIPLDYETPACPPPKGYLLDGKFYTAEEWDARCLDSQKDPRVVPNQSNINDR